MVQQIVQHFLWQKSGTYYFARRVPKDIQEHYTASRVVIYLKTTRRDSALKASRSISQRLEDYWLSLRLSKLDTCDFHVPVWRHIRRVHYRCCVRRGYRSVAPRKP